MRGRKPKIMHVIGTLVYADSVCGGSEKMFLTTLEGLQKLGNTENIGCVMSKKPNGLDSSLSARIIGLGVPRSEFYPLRAFFKLFEIPLFFLVILKESPDILYCYHNTDDKLLTAGLGKLLGKKVAIRKNMEEAHTPTISQRLSPLTYSLCDRIVTVFQDGVNELRDMGMPAERIICIPNGKDAKKFRKIASRKAAKKKLGLGEEEFIIGTVSRLDPIKNQETIIRALPEILKKEKGAKFVIVGGHPRDNYKKRLLALAGEKGVEKHVLFLGHREDIDEILRAFDVFVHPSLSDACPGSVIEAMFTGLPIVASNVKGTRELLQDGGIILNPTDEKEFAGVLKQLMNDPALREGWGKKALKKANKEFSLEKMLNSYDKLFRGLIT